MRVLTGLLIVAVATLVAVGGLVLVQSLVSTERRKQHNDVAGFIYAVLSVSYAVLLGLMLIAVWEQWNAAQDVASDEANELAGIFYFAHALPQPEGRHIQGTRPLLRSGGGRGGWPLMEQGRSSPKAWATLDELRGRHLGTRPHHRCPASALQPSLGAAAPLGDARRERLLAASGGLSPILWVVLIGGAVITIAFTYIFGLENTVVHTLMVAALAMILSLSLFTVAALDYPFKGDVRIHPAAFEQVLERFPREQAQRYPMEFGDHPSIHRSAWNRNSANFVFTEF